VPEESLSIPSIRSSIDPLVATPKIVKLGGSLLDLPDYIQRLSGFIDTVVNPVIIVGGGPAADLVRQWDRTGILNCQQAHWMAIAAMSFNGLQLTQQCDQFRVAANREDSASIAAQGMTPVLDVMRLLRTDEAFSEIPESWDVTSDSISAFIAGAWTAELCLLKSVNPGSNPAEYLDPCFSHAASSLTEFEWVNLRSDMLRPDVVRLHPNTVDTRCDRSL
jgi:hypothetical protein